ncbi:MAG: GGDEF domain-containing protein, partial [Gammaproteobacteria bacterium]|nr:GGDEF domain-containing protein [Gammaproteobacteria bacterium]
MKDDQGWKKKYYDLEKKQKNEHTSNKETQELLTRTIIRLTLATKGLDPALDPHLQKLRDSLKKGINTNA